MSSAVGSQNCKKCEPRNSNQGTNYLSVALVSRDMQYTTLTDEIFESFFGGERVNMHVLLASPLLLIFRNVSLSNSECSEGLTHSNLLL